MDELASTDRSSAYDRAGTGQSDAAPSPWTTQDQVHDLAVLLETAGVRTIREISYSNRIDPITC